MATILPFTMGRRSGVPKTDDRSPRGELVFFPGVRYEHEDNDGGNSPDTVTRKGKRSGGQR